MRLFIERIGQSLLLMSSAHRFYLRFDQLLFIVFKPRCLLFQLLLQENIGFPVLIHILQ